MSRAVNRVVMENIVLAVGIKAAILVLVMLGKARLWLAVASDGLSLLAVVLNGLKPLCIARWVFRDTDEPLPAETRRDGYGSV
jgi:cation transport ATPase